MYNCQCPTSESGYDKRKCVSGRCSDCKSTKPHFKCALSEKEVKITQFVVTETPYKRSADGKTMGKIFKKKFFMTCLSKMPILRCLQQQNCILCTGFKFTVTPFTG